jgi:hypothetical protein
MVPQMKEFALSLRGDFGLGLLSDAGVVKIWGLLGME